MFLYMKNKNTLFDEWLLMALVNVIFDLHTSPLGMDA